MTLSASIHRIARLLTLGLALHATWASAQSFTPPVASIAAPADTPYVGTIAIDVDLTDLDRRIMEVRETLPVKPGPLTLLYPRWLPGKHSPAGAVTTMAGLQITADGKPVEWTRDPVDVYAFHLQVPNGVDTLNIAFQHLSPVSPTAGRVVMTQEIIGLQWNTVVLYPAGHYASAIQTQVSAKLPAGWQTASALDVAKRDGDVGGVVLIGRRCAAIGLADPDRRCCGICNAALEKAGPGQYRQQCNRQQREPL